MVIFLVLMNAILQEAGGAWDNPPDSETLDLLKNKFQSMAQEMIKMHSRDNLDRDWGWKDPRTSLTVDYYLPYLKNPHIIWCNRSTDEITNSLWKRNKIPHQEGSLLIEEYQQRIGKFIEQNPDLPLIKLQYHEVIQDPEYWVKTISKFLKLAPNDDQISLAVKFILPRGKVDQEKLIFKLKYLVSLPSRAYKKYISKSK